MNEFKIGDMALIVASNNPENIGKVVELISFHLSSVDTVVTPDGKQFGNFLGEDAWVIKAELIVTHPIFGKIECQYSVIPPRKLMPLRGDFAPERQKSQEVPV